MMDIYFTPTDVTDWHCKKRYLEDMKTYNSHNYMIQVYMKDIVKKKDACKINIILCAAKMLDLLNVLKVIH